MITLCPTAWAGQRHGLQPTRNAFIEFAERRDAPDPAVPVRILREVMLVVVGAEVGNITKGRTVATPVVPRRLGFSRPQRCRPVEQIQLRRLI